MSLELPTPTVTLGPEWASELNAALEIVDAHTHAPGSGVQIPTAGLNINANLSVNDFKIYDLMSTQYSSQSATLTGAANANSLYVVSGNVYFTNGSGVAVQITSGGSIVSAPADVQALEYATVASNLAINASDTFVFLSVDTNAARTITFPLASSVVTGRIYYVKDETGLSNTNAISFATSGGDTIDSNELTSNFGSIGFISDGVSHWESF